MPAPDQAQRDRALSPGHSFIVQAPAGSGKTELLIQRYLVLLGRVERPESVVAITFTRKAAGEMRRRVLAALERAGGPQPESSHERRTWELAKCVRARDSQRGWNLFENPHRLEIRTIDSFCTSLVRRMPWLSRLGPPPEVVENACELYQEAAHRTVALVEDDLYAEPVGRLLLHLDNDVPALESLIAGMLERRDQWLRHVGISCDREQQRQALESALEGAVVDALEAVRNAVPHELVHELPRFADFAARNLAAEDYGSPVLACAGMRRLPGTRPEDLPAWRGLASLLLTKNGARRVKVDRRSGFPPESRQEKRAFLALLMLLDASPQFCKCLHALHSLPPTRYSDEQWAIVDALLTVLPVAVANLWIVFQERAQIDFAEIMLGALRALETDQGPTDLALALDCRIEHLLIDEFQDTSFSQFDLIAKLTSGWTQGDGRTLFLVGDPMQSIYRFREAEVGLFLRAAREGIGSVRLEPLQLTANFRSQRGIVEWVNRAFPGVLSPEDDVTTGAVRFSSSMPQRGGEEGEAVRFYAFFKPYDEAEAKRVTEIIRESRATAPKASIAVLVRARTHLPSILRALRTAGLRYQAIEIDRLSELPLIQDLLALTRALLHLADRVAWLAVLRAPWCGLTLADLHELVAGDPNAVMWDLVRDENRIARLTPAGAIRLRRVRSVFDACFMSRPATLREMVESAWIALGGPACVNGIGSLDDANTYFALLEEVDEGCEAGLDDLSERVTTLFAASDPEADGSLQVMSIHKAKGLEFDIVIVPGLGRSPKRDESRLLLWAERPRLAGGGLLLAPIKPTGAGKDLIYEFVRDFDRKKADHETGRLLYVACTRAKQRLHLLGHTGYKDGEVSEPGAGSLLARLWNSVSDVFEVIPPPLDTQGDQIVLPPPQVLRRLTCDWSLPEPPAGPAWREKESFDVEPVPPREPISYYWVSDMLRHAGTVVHALLNEIAREGVEAWSPERIRASRTTISTALKMLGIGPHELPEAEARVEEALQRTLADPRGRWILNASHQDAHSEYELTGVYYERVASIRIDRTFIDKTGTRWIIDFKTSSHEGSDLESFLDNERERYRTQMEMYCTFFALRGAQKIRAALYFPLLGAWREYAFSFKNIHPIKLHVQ